MIWQDAVVAIANVMFSYSLIYQVMHGFRKKKKFLTLTTSGLTFAGLYAVAIAFFTLNMVFSAAIAGVNATLWLILFVQGMTYRK